jgi:predicted nucleic acid-binding protein
MNLVVDACVFVAEQIEDQREFAAADAFFDHCVRNGIRLYALALVLAEVAGAVARITGDSAMGGVSTTRLSHFPKLYLRQVDLSLAEAAARAAARLSLRGADSHYVALARELKCPLITNDDEVIQRCPPTMKVLRPDKWLDLQPDH